MIKVYFTFVLIVISTLISFSIALIPTLFLNFIFDSIVVFFISLYFITVPLASMLIYKILSYLDDKFDLL